MKTKKIGDIITYPIGLILVIGISGICIVSYIALRSFGPLYSIKNNKKID